MSSLPPFRPPQQQALSTADNEINLGTWPPLSSTISPANLARSYYYHHPSSPLRSATDADLEHPLFSPWIANPNEPNPSRSSLQQQQHKQWKQKQIEAGLIDPVTMDFVPRPPGVLLHLLKSIFKIGAAIFALIILAGQILSGDPIWGYRTKWMHRRFWSQPRPMTVAELSLYDGRESELPIYLAIKGDVYDVSPKRYIYGPDGGYAFFAGRDASRAFVTGCFQDHLTHDLRGLLDTDLRTLDRWHAFFEKNDNYVRVGYLVDLPTIDPAAPVPTGICMVQPST